MGNVYIILRQMDKDIGNEINEAVDTFDADEVTSEVKFRACKSILCAHVAMRS